MHDRIKQGYRRKFRSLLARVRPRRLDFGVDLLMGRARRLSEKEGLPLPAALARVYEFTRQRVERRVRLMAACAVGPAGTAEPQEPPRFVCDASLGGLARWLRAMGYEADWSPSWTPEKALAEAEARGGVLLTTQAAILERRAVTQGRLPVVWIPSSSALQEQLAMVLRDLSLPRREPRCMACGGALRSVPKAEVEERIPPRTRGWKDEYFVCDGCGKLYWQGTHWERILRRLQEDSA